MIQERHHVVCLRILPNGTEEVLDIVPHNPKNEALYDHFSWARLNFWVNGNFGIAYIHLRNPEVEVLKNIHGKNEGMELNPKAKELARAEHMIYGPALFVMLTK